MTKVPSLPYDQIIRALQRDGWVVVRQKGSHVRLQKRTSTETLKLTIPAHRPIKRSTLSHVLKKEIKRNFDAAPGTREGDRLDVLTTLVEAYEEKHFRIPLPDPIEAILHYVETRGLARRDLERYIGSRARVSEVLNRKRPLTMDMIRNLHKGLGIPAEVLIQPYRTLKDAA